MSQFLLAGAFLTAVSRVAVPLLTLKMAVICYINTTLKEFSHIIGEAHDIDLKGAGAGIMLNQTRAIIITITNTSEINQSL